MAAASSGTPRQVRVAYHERARIGKVNPLAHESNRATLVDFCLTLLNSNEFLYLE
jgi:hypothetical protein